MKITADRFFDVFAKALRAALTQDGVDWPRTYQSDAAWTPEMLKVLRSVGSSLNETVDVSREYMRLDVTYRSRLLADPAAWNMDVAIEHENNSKTWHDEWVKLNHVVCGLKVLITYYDYRGGKGEQDLLDSLAHARRLYDCLDYHQSDDAWLLIFGPTFHRRRDWLGYTFDGRDFSQRFRIKAADLPLWVADTATIHWPIDSNAHS